MASLKQLERDIAAITQRNKRVEADKAWETSWSRKLVILVLTYLAIAAYFYAVGLPNPLVNSVVPAVAFVISTMTLPYFKEIWLSHVHK